MTINLKNEMIKINELLLLHQKTKVILTKKIDNLLKALDTDEAKTKLQQEQIDKVKAKAKEILSYLSKWLKGSSNSSPYTWFLSRAYHLWIRINHIKHLHINILKVVNFCYNLLRLIQVLRLIQRALK